MPLFKVNFHMGVNHESCYTAVLRGLRDGNCRSCLTTSQRDLQRVNSQRSFWSTFKILGLFRSLEVQKTIGTFQLLKCWSHSMG